MLRDVTPITYSRTPSPSRTQCDLNSQFRDTVRDSKSRRFSQIAPLRSAPSGDGLLRSESHVLVTVHALTAVPSDTHRAKSKVEIFSAENCAYFSCDPYTPRMAQGSRSPATCGHASPRELLGDDLVPQAGHPCRRRIVSGGLTWEHSEAPDLGLNPMKTAAQYRIHPVGPDDCMTSSRGHQRYFGISSKTEQNVE